MQEKNIHINSPSQKAWRRLRKNKPAIFGMFIIGLAVLTAIFAYVLATDNTPNANDQVIEIPLQNPGFTTQMLLVKKNTTVPKGSFLNHILSGTPNPYKQIPIQNYQFLGDSIYVQQFAAENTTPQYKSFHLAQVVYPLSIDKKEIVKQADQVEFYGINNKLIQTSITDLQNQIETVQIKQKRYLLGTDRYGRDVWSRLLLGVRISLLVGLIAVIISLTIGVLVGAIAGYFGGRLDDFILFIINTIWSIPTLLLVFAIILALGKNIINIFIAVGLTMWVDVARIVRGQVMTYKEIQFVEAAKSMGFKDGRIILKHILPNIMGPVMVIASANFATAILIEAGLSYLGFGIQPPTPSWGNMLNENYGYAISGKIFLALVPASAIAILVLAFNLLGNGIRDALDVKGNT